MQVNLKRAWFAPNNVLYSTENNPHDFPIDWEGLLPDGAEVVGRGIVGSEEYKEKGKLPKSPVDPAAADDPKVDGLTAGNKPQDAPAVVDGTEEDNSNLTTAEAEKVKAQQEKAAQAGVGATGARPDGQPQENAAAAAKQGSTT